MKMVKKSKKVFSLDIKSGHLERGWWLVKTGKGLEIWDSGSVLFLELGGITSVFSFFKSYTLTLYTFTYIL